MSQREGMWPTYRMPYQIGFTERKLLCAAAAAAEGSLC